jgi:hypothetical protein
MKNLYSFLLQALEVTIDFYTPEHGFEELPQILKEFVHNCIVLDVCPTLVRKAFMDGMTWKSKSCLSRSSRPNHNAKQCAG